MKANRKAKPSLLDIDKAREMQQSLKAGVDENLVNP